MMHRFAWFAFHCVNEYIYIQFMGGLQNVLSHHIYQFGGNLTHKGHGWFEKLLDILQFKLL
jgi:hypothetical protein